MWWILRICVKYRPQVKQVFVEYSFLVILPIHYLFSPPYRGVLLYSMLAEPRLKKTKFLLVLSKMDLAYRQMRNEALLMLQMEKFQKQIPQHITIVQFSAITKEGIDEVYDWLAMN